MTIVDLVKKRRMNIGVEIHHRQAMRYVQLKDKAEVRAAQRQGRDPCSSCVQDPVYAGSGSAHAGPGTCPLDMVVLFSGVITDSSHKYVD